MPAATRINDTTVGTCSIGAKCCPHARSGNNTNGSGNVFINGLSAHRLGDNGACNCPHGGIFSSTSGSKSVFVNGKPAVRAGDSTACNMCGVGGTHTSGSSNVFIGG